MNTQTTSMSPAEEEALNNENIVFAPAQPTPEPLTAESLEADIDAAAQSLSDDAPVGNPVELNFSTEAKAVMFEFLPHLFTDGLEGEMSTDGLAFAEFEASDKYPQGAVEVKPTTEGLADSFAIVLPIEQRTDTSITLGVMSREEQAQPATLEADEAPVNPTDATIDPTYGGNVILNVDNLTVSGATLPDNIPTLPLADVVEGQQVGAGAIASPQVVAEVVTEAPKQEEAPVKVEGGLSQDSVEKIKSWNEHRKPPKAGKTNPQAVLIAPAPSRTAELLQRTMAKKVWAPQVDGKDHINFSNNSTTELGRLLRTKTLLPFRHPELGPFACIAGLMYFLQDPESNSSFREWAENTVLYRGRNLEQLQTPDTFKEVVAEALWVRTLQHPEVAKAMLENDLPYVCYYIEDVGGVEVHRAVKSLQWLLPVYEEIAATVKMRAGMTDKEASNRLVPDFGWLVQEREQRERQQAREAEREARERDRDQGRTRGERGQRR